MIRSRATAAAFTVVLAATFLTGCGASAAHRTVSGSPIAASSHTSKPITSHAATSAPVTTPTHTAPARPSAQSVFDAMSEAQRVGQLFMVDAPSTYVRTATLDAIDDDAVGSVILDGTSYLTATQTLQITRQLQGHAPAHVALFVATDQEGGQVQRLQGPGFAAIPTAVEQGGYSPSQLRADAKYWGGELHRVGVNVDLAPVLDTVPPDWGSNAAIGDLDREYGHTTAAVAAHGLAFAQGLADAGVVATVKHFPGLGRTYGNTDLTGSVEDTVTTRHDPYLAPFADAINAGVPFVMVSTAIYTKIDPVRPAAFSPTIVTGMLRDDLGFGGVIISDDVGIAAQVSNYTVAQRAVDFVQAGGDIVLTVDATQAPTMTAAVLQLAQTNSAFRAKVDAAALTVLQAKQAAGLIH
ncbi:MAG TPA: glycoside hydrolase family 3 N-terminal domain-containing protein [Jatrophihabitantaceae bacterium]